MDIPTVNFDLVLSQISPFSVLQAISQAEMYQNVSTRAFVASPEDEINSFKCGL
jgi:hypothetical protein